MRIKSARGKNTEEVPKEALLSAPPPPVQAPEECSQNPDIIKNIKVAPNEDVDLVEEGEDTPEETLEERTTAAATLQSLEERRKKVEEENRRRKRVLAKAIAER